MIGLLIVMVLSGVAIIATRNVMMELRQVGSYRTATVARWVGENGVEASLARSMSDPVAFVDYLKLNQFRVTMADVVTDTPFYDTTRLGSFGLEYGAYNAVDYVSIFSNPVTVQSAPGFINSGGTNQVFVRYRVETRGKLGVYATADTVADQTIPESDIDAVLKNSEVLFVNFLYIGPI